MTLNKAQQAALWNVYRRKNPSATMPDWRRGYVRFRRTVRIGRDYAMVKWCDMWLGIERDGYTHS